MDIAFLTSTVDATEAVEVDGPLIDALARRGITVTQVCWDTPDIDCARFAAAVVRTTWNYQQQRDTFLDVLAHIAATTCLINPLALIRWNTHKQYLADLEDQGVPVIPTVVIPQGHDVDLAVVAHTHNFTDMVIKPAVGAGGRGVARGTTTTLRDTFHTLVTHEDVVVQPYLDGIETHGETSVIVAGDTVTHAVTKRPAAGDFRAHERFGATYSAITPTGAERDLALWITTQLKPARPTLARIDLVRDSQGSVYVSEVELTEPNLYLTIAPAAAQMIATQLITALPPR